MALRHAVVVLVVFFYVGSCAVIIDPATDSASPLISIVSQPASYDLWYSPYDSSHPPTVRLQNVASVLGGQRDVVIGHYSDTPEGSVAIVAVSPAAGVSISLPLNWHGKVYFQYDGNDAGTPFPGAVLNSLPGLGAATSSIPERNSDNWSIDFASTGVAFYLEINNDLDIDLFIDCLDTSNRHNRLQTDIPTSASYTPHTVAFSDSRWSDSSFDWSHVTSVQLAIAGDAMNAPDITFKAFQTRGAYQFTGKVQLQCACTGGFTNVTGEPIYVYYSNDTLVGVTGTNSQGAFTFSNLEDGQSYKICVESPTCSPVGGCFTTNTLANYVSPSAFSFVLSDRGNLVIPTDAVVACNEFCSPCQQDALFISECTGSQSVEAVTQISTGSCPTILQRTFTAGGENQTQTITITDTNSPVFITQPSSPVVECTSATLNSNYQAWLGNNGGAIATDACSSVTFTNNAPGSLSSGCTTETVTFTASDTCGNRALATATYRSIDNTPPSFSTPASPLTVSCDATSSIMNWLVSNGGASATDSCSGSIITWSNNLGQVPTCSSTQVTFSVQDLCGNIATTTATLTVTDTSPPIFSTQANGLTVSCDSDVSTLYNSWLASNGGATASDSCGIVSFTNSSPAPPTGACAARSVTFTASDTCGNSARTTATFQIVDFQAPVLIIPASALSVSCSSSTQNSINSWLNSNGGAVASDNCSGALSWTNNYSGQVPLCSSTQVTFRVSDTCGSQTATTAMLSVNDFNPPTFNIPASSITVPCESDVSSQYNSWLSTNGGAQATDSCPLSSISFTNNSSGPPNSGCSQSVVTFTARDNCGNSARSTATFSTIDSSPPSWSQLPEDSSAVCSGTSFSEPFDIWLNSNGGGIATDSCSTVIYSNDFSGSPECPSENVVHFTAEDSCGRSILATATFSFIFGSRSSTKSETPSITATISESVTISSTPTGSLSVGASVSPSPTQSASQTGTQTRTSSKSRTPSKSQSNSGSISFSISESISESATPTTSLSLGASISSTPTISVSGTQSRTPSLTSTISVSADPSPTSSNSETRSATQTGTQTRTPSSSLSETPTSSETPVPSETPSATITGSDSPSFTISETRTATGTPTPSRTASRTETSSKSTTGSISESKTPSSTPTVTDTPSSSSSISKSVSTTGSISRSQTRTRTASRSNSASGTSSRSSSTSKSISRTPSGSRTPSRSI